MNKMKKIEITQRKKQQFLCYFNNISSYWEISVLSAGKFAEYIISAIFQVIMLYHFFGYIEIGKFNDTLGDILLLMNFSMSKFVSFIMSVQNFSFICFCHVFGNGVENSADFTSRNLRYTQSVTDQIYTRSICLIVKKNFSLT